MLSFEGDVAEQLSMHNKSKKEHLRGLREVPSIQRMGYDLQEHIFNTLGLQNTYLFTDVIDSSPIPMLYKANKFHVPNSMATVIAEGGVVSTTKETMTIIKVFFSGECFPVEDLEELKQWKFVFFPFQCYLGVGLEKLWAPRI